MNERDVDGFRGGQDVLALGFRKAPRAPMFKGRRSLRLRGGPVGIGGLPSQRGQPDEIDHLDALLLRRRVS